jgi:hypothetical protein
VRDTQTFFTETTLAMEDTWRSLSCSEFRINNFYDRFYLKHLKLKKQYEKLEDVDTDNLITQNLFHSTGELVPETLIMSIEGFNRFVFSSKVFNV